MKLLLALSFFIGATSALAQHPDETATQSWKIHLELQVITLDARKARPLLWDLRDDAKIAEAYKRLEAMIDSGDAKMVASLGAHTLHAKDVHLRQVEEVKYPLDFDGPRVVESTAEHRLNKLRPSEKRDAVAYPARTFETRGVGITMKAVPIVTPDGKRLSIEVAAEHTWLLKWDEFEAGRLANNEKILWKQPRFATAMVESICGMLSGERLLLSSHSVPNETDQMELFFLRVWTTPITGDPK